MTTGHVDPGRLADGRPDPRRGRVRVVRQQRHDRAAVRPDVRGIDAAVGADEAVRRLGDHERRWPSGRRASRGAAPARPGARRGPSARRTRPPRPAARRWRGPRSRPPPWTRPSGSRRGRRRRAPAGRSGVASRAATTSWARSSPGRISGMPSSAMTSMRARLALAPSATERAELRLGRQEIGRGVEVQRERAVELDDRRAGVDRRGAVTIEAVRARTPARSSAGGLTRSAFVPLPCRSGTMATTPVPPRPASAAASTRPSTRERRDRGQVGREHDDRRRVRARLRPTGRPRSPRSGPAPAPRARSPGGLGRARRRPDPSSPRPCPRSAPRRASRRASASGGR